VSQTRSDAEDLDGAPGAIEPQDAAELKAAGSTGTREKKSRAERRAEQDKARAKAKTAAPERKAAPRKKRTSPALFYRQIVAELRKVVWPTRTELFTYTSVVIVFVLVIIGIVALIDLGLTHAVQAVFG
jgi:preprotein translocase subunit SecE